jgi:hypothetical protein
MKMNFKIGLLFANTFMAIAVVAAEQEKEGIHIGERITLRPYVSFSYSYDSNTSSGRRDSSASSWTITPGINTQYKDDNWNVNLGLSYNYHAYNRSTSELNSSSYREQLSLDWRNSAADERGWSLNIAQHIAQISQDDDMTNSGGRGYSRDRMEMGFNGSLERRINSYLHASADVSYYYLDYDNNSTKYLPLYGWQRTNIGGTAGWMFSRWTDLLISGEYFTDHQENDKDYSNPSANRISDGSTGYSVMVGVGSRATERIEYRVMGGWGVYEFGDGLDSSGMFRYSFSANWKINPTLSATALGSSYFQPSERYYGTSTRVYSFSAGLRKTFLANDLSVSGDVSYRIETHEYTSSDSYNYDTDVMTFRLRSDYKINKWISIYGSLEYYDEQNDNKSSRGGRNYDYDRWRGTIGFRLRY